MKTIVSEQQRHHEPNGPNVKVLKQSNLKFNLITDSSPRDNVPDLPLMWDSLESDTESLVQEKEYQRELQMRIGFSAENSKHCAKTASEEEHLDVYDSLDLKPRTHEPLRQTPPEDEYADLRYDPNWRKNQEGGQFLNQLNGRLSLSSSEDSFKPLENVALGSRRDYVVVSNPPTVQMEKDLSQSPSSPFHLHPHQEDILDSPESKSSCMSSEGTPWDDGEHLNVKSVSPQKTSSRQISDPRPVRSKEDIVERNKATLGLNTHKQGSYLNALQQKDKPDQTKQPRKTSYETISTCSPESQDNVRDPELMWLQKTQKLKQSHKERKEPKRREKTSNHPDQPKPPVPESKPSAHLIKPLPERHVVSADGLSQDSPVAYTHDPPQHQSRLPSYTHAPPTVNLNINLQTPANPAQPLNLSQKETIVTLVSKALQWDSLGLLNPPFLQPGYHHSVLPNSEGQMRLAPKAVVSSPAPHSGVVHAVDRSVPQRHAGKPLNNAFENSSFKNHNRLRIPMLKLPTSPQVEAGHYPPEVLPNDDESVGPFVPPTQISALYTVLPPIGRANGSDTELGSNRSEQLLNPIHRSSSEGYLSQMEKYRQLKAKTNYKAYTLKDYKDMRQEVKLGGLGPTNTIPEAVAEKIRRQKLYSNVIREQNKKISRIPSLSSKDPVGSDNKDTVPRRKALEYAKTIAKPKPPPKSKDRPREQPQYLQETDPTHLATLEMLRRHEDEKRAVACFRTIHAI